MDYDGAAARPNLRPRVIHAPITAAGRNLLDERSDRECRRAKGVKEPLPQSFWYAGKEYYVS
ncbi:hypothetical protein GFS60_06579 (plasmid) [Rhodococcus sp. WAY2]|nr:hypothetical protein GFS60_06579 [Rhodococcus sp. WAY2]